MKVRHTPTPAGERRDAHDPKWATVLILAGLAAITLLVTRAPEKVPVVLAPLVGILGVRRRCR